MKQGKNADIYKRYLIAEAAGMYWLYDPLQPEGEYQKPLMMNEFGKEVVKRWISGMPEEEVIKEIISETDADPEMVRNDLKMFFENLHTQGY